MSSDEIPDPLFRQAVAVLDAGDLAALERLVSEHPRLLRERMEYGEGYFRRPYLLWFVAGNPLRHERLPANIVAVARLLLQAVELHAADSLPLQRDYALTLVCSGRVPREQGVQRELIDLFAEAGADLDAAMVPALAHRERAAAERLLEHGATLTLLVAACTGRKAELVRLAREAGPAERHLAVAGAALHGMPEALAHLVGLGVDLSACGPPEFHPHATPLHHAVDSGSLDAVRVLVEAGASLDAKDRLHQGTPLDWAEYLRRPEIASYLREREHSRGRPGGDDL